MAYYHSHPASEPYPSATDVRRVVIGRARLVIVTLREDMTRLRSFFVEEGTIEEEVVEIIDEKQTGSG
ncbi:MAG: Mov34/MPN/PAD-1 family protein [Chloroflexi bacterium]|nr:Mov34/MPN/PAD-1 family protein [Chloroflexota bacterium]